MTVKETIQAIIDGETLVNRSGGELSFDPSYRTPFRFRICTSSGVLADMTHPLRVFRDGEWLRAPIGEDPADWMEKPEYARAKLWMERCEAARVEANMLRIRLEKLQREDH